MQTCSFCGHGNPVGRRHCESCGAEISADGEGVAPSPGAPLSELDAALADLLEREGKIAAIKHYRSVTGHGLKEAKDYVERLARDADIAVRGAGTGCGMSLLALAAAALAMVLT